MGLKPRGDGITSSNRGISCPTKITHVLKKKEQKEMMIDVQIKIIAESEKT